MWQEWGKQRPRGEPGRCGAASERDFLLQAALRQRGRGGEPGKEAGNIWEHLQEEGDATGKGMWGQGCPPLKKVSCWGPALRDALGCGLPGPPKDQVSCTRMERPPPRATRRALRRKETPTPPAAPGSVPTLTQPLSKHRGHPALPSGTTRSQGDRKVRKLEPLRFCLNSLRSQVHPLC